MCKRSAHLSRVQRFGGCTCHIQACDMHGATTLSLQTTPFGARYLVGSAGARSIHFSPALHVFRMQCAAPNAHLTFAVGPVKTSIYRSVLCIIQQVTVPSRLHPMSPKPDFCANCTRIHLACYVSTHTEVCTHTTVHNRLTLSSRFTVAVCAPLRSHASGRPSLRLCTRGRKPLRQRVTCGAGANGS
jgi:hypothetical protein